MLVLTFQVTFKMLLGPPEALLQPDLENNFLCLILLSDRGCLQKYMWLHKLQSVLHVQHENKVLNPEASSIMRALSGARCTDVRLYT